MEDDMWSRMTFEDPWDTWDTGELGQDEEFVKVVELNDEQEKVMNNTVSQVDWNNAPEGAQFYSCGLFRKLVVEDQTEFYWSGDEWFESNYEPITLHQETYSDYQMRPCLNIDWFKESVKTSSEDYHRTLKVKESEVLADYVIPPKHKSSIDFLDEVKSIQSQRSAEYEQDGGERSFAKVATVFNTYTGKDLQPSDIALMLEILKNVRFYSQDGYHSDSVVDKISYGSLWAELVTGERT